MRAGVYLLCPASQEHRRLETQKPVRWPPAERDGQPAQTLQPRPDDGRRQGRRSAAKNDSSATAVAWTLPFATLRDLQPCHVSAFSDWGLTFDLSGLP